MKKIIAIAVAAITLVSSTFALDLEVGARGILGKTFTNDMKALGEEFKGVNINTPMDYGFGVYGNFALFGGLGIQAEVNVMKGGVEFTGEKIDKNTANKENIKKTEFEQWLIDVPVMAWLNLDCWKLTIGFGTGVNFSFAMDPTTDIQKIKDDVKGIYGDKNFTVGLVTGADVKFYLTDNLGIVLSGRWILNFEKTTAKYPIEIADGIGTEVELPSIEFKRNAIYGGLGVEWKLF